MDGILETQQMRNAYSARLEISSNTAQVDKNVDSLIKENEYLDSKPSNKLDKRAKAFLRQNSIKKKDLLNSNRVLRFDRLGLEQGSRSRSAEELL